LAYVRFVAGFALQFVYATFVVFGCLSMVFGAGLLLYHVCAFERYLDVCLFKEVCDFSDFWTTKCEDGPFLVFVVGFVLSISFQFCYVMKGEFVVLCDGEDFFAILFLPKYSQIKQNIKEISLLDTHKSQE